eukprot:TRINITY_DN5775_c0_g1_i2.p2 TRINITY_DN5775_c0_g1~~TRINITY_DN5775_c0_g1_i2.p2  ORF type:complete len:307 (-),score=86.35 TRINITY_DN5775_c0_g1_i2:1350-2219(-)
MKSHKRKRTKSKSDDHVVKKKRKVIKEKNEDIEVLSGENNLVSADSKFHGKVAETGAVKGDILMGMSMANQGLLIKVIGYVRVNDQGEELVEDVVLPLPNPDKVYALRENGEWDNEEKLDPFKVKRLHGKTYVTPLEIALSLSHEDLKELDSEGYDINLFCNAFLFSFGRFKDDPLIAEVGKKHASKIRKLKKTEIWDKFYNRKNKGFSDVLFELIEPGEGNRSWAFESAWLNCSNKERGITYQDVKEEILLRPELTDGKPPTYFLNYHNLALANKGLSIEEKLKYYQP